MPTCSTPPDPCLAPAPRPRARNESAWPGRLAIVAAALASIATSPPRWRLEATSPGAPPGPNTGLLFVVESSHEPDVSAKRGAARRQLFPVAAGAPTGRNEYYAPPGWQVSQIEIVDRCTSGGGFCSNCEPPPGAFVRIGATTAVEPWSLSADSSEETVQLDSSVPRQTYEVTVEASGRPTLEVVAAAGPRGLASWVDQHGVKPLGGGKSSYTFRVYWSYSDGSTDVLSAPVRQRFGVRATLDGFCRAGEAAPGRCAAPESAGVTISGLGLAPSP